MGLALEDLAHLTDIRWFGDGHRGRLLVRARTVDAGADRKDATREVVDGADISGVGGGSRGGGPERSEAERRNRGDEQEAQAESLSQVSVLGKGARVLPTPRPFTLVRTLRQNATALQRDGFTLGVLNLGAPRSIAWDQDGDREAAEGIGR